MRFYSDAAMGPEWDAPDGPEFTLHVLPARHARAVICGPYAFAESALADLLDWVYGLGAFCGWVTDADGRVVDEAGGACAIPTGHDDAEAA